MASLLISRYLRGPNATIPFVLGFTVLSLSLLPSVCALADPARPCPDAERGDRDGGAGVSHLGRKIARLVVIFTMIKLIPQYALSFILVTGILIDPKIIDRAAYTLVGAFSENLPPLDVPISFILEIYVLRPAVLFTFVMPITLGFFLLLDTRLKRTALTWYGAPLINSHPVALLGGLTGWLALILWFVVLPFYNVATAPTAHTLLDALILGRMALVLLLSGILAVFLRRTHRQYAHRCPACAGWIPGPYRLGLSCPHCKTVLHPWLLANY
jgi:hypothetical protein